MSAWLDALRPAERAEREAILAAGGRMAAVMRAAEAASWPPGMLADVWLWAIWLVMVRGYRGATTSANYVRGLGLLGAWLCAQDPVPDWERINLNELEAWLKHLFVRRRHGKSWRSVCTSAVKSFYRWRSARGRGRDCSFGLVAPRLDRRVPRRHTAKELRAIFAVVDQARTEQMRVRNRALLLLLLTTGARREEVSSLNVRDLTFDGRVAVVRIFGKGSKEREVGIEGPVITALLAWIELRRKMPVPDDALFVGFHSAAGAQRLSPGGVERIVKRHAQLAGARYAGVHVYRVTFATQLYDDGTDIERIRIVMGHESIETTRRYIAVSNRQRGVRLKPHRQHAVLGTAPEGLPRWARELEGLRD